MLPIWPNTDNIPLWFWLLLIVVLIGIGFGAAEGGIDPDVAILRLQQAIAAIVLAAGLFWIWMGAKVILRLRALRRNSVEGEAKITEFYSSSMRVEQTSALSVTKTSYVAQHFLTYRLKHPAGEISSKRMRIDDKLAADLKEGGTLKVRYLADRPHISAPADIAVRKVEIMRAAQLVAGLALVIWSVGWLSPGVLWPAG